MRNTSNIAARAEHLTLRRELLAREKQLTRELDDTAAQRRKLPWVRVEQTYRFLHQHGEKSISDLFDGQGQLIIYHFMFAPDASAGCPSCSFWADHFDSVRPHLHARGVALAVVSRAQPDTLHTFADRMGWRFPWYSDADERFSRDFGAYFTDAEIAAGEPRYNFGEAPRPHADHPGLSVFARNEDGDVFHTYSCYARGLEAANATYHLLDLTPRGRDESELPFTMAWVRFKDEYGS